jgi:hypothetical protein
VSSGSIYTKTRIAADCAGRLNVIITFSSSKENNMPTDAQLLADVPIFQLLDNDEQAVLAIQGALVLARALNARAVFTRALAQAQSALALPTPARERVGVRRL